MQERRGIIDCMEEVNQHRRWLIARTGGGNLKETLILSEHANLKGAEAVGVVVPDFIDPDDNSIFEYYQAIDRHITIPLMIYDPRGSGPYSPSPGLVERLVDEIPSVSGLKYRTTNGEYMANMARIVGDKLALLSGNEYTLLQDLSIGASGCVGGGANFYPNLLHKIYTLFKEDDIAQARSLQFQIIEAMHALSDVYWPLSGKIVLQELGIPFQLITRVRGEPFDEDAVAYIRTTYSHYLKMERELIELDPEDLLTEG
ncbi:hypothetical protein BVY01_04035 [bacterium I07]|nr:hypothetical protein BVY01_04035 [bacterium I07]